MKAVIALGSNLENRRLNLDIAITKLEELLGELTVSQYFETKPVQSYLLINYLQSYWLSRMRWGGFEKFIGDHALLI